MGRPRGRVPGNRQAMCCRYALAPDDYRRGRVQVPFPIWAVMTHNPPRTGGSWPAIVL